MVRCALCSTTWLQTAIDESVDKREHVSHIIKWTFFWFSVLVFMFLLLFTKNVAMRIWPPVTCFYDFLGINPLDTKKTFVIKNMSNFFKRKDGKLYMGLKGELINGSNDVQIMPSLVISLRNENNEQSGASQVSYRKEWTHDLMYNKLLPNQKVTFETEMQSVPYSNLICDIKLDVL
ncbi:hypothetical protein FACS1894122_03190 [Alphaproteobacteria bacterium]|nr:hypothetical protein FACS1894122_03190 [Alphaproteobacteria bacterium]